MVAATVALHPRIKDTASVRADVFGALRRTSDETVARDSAPNFKSQHQGLVSAGSSDVAPPAVNNSTGVVTNGMPLVPTLQVARRCTRIRDG
jgi:hypothetical protein